MDTVGASTRVAVLAVCLDPPTYEAISYFMAGVPGALVLGNLDHYAGAEREISRALELARVCICFIDYDRSVEEATWIMDRLRSEHAAVYGFAVSSSSEPDAIIGAMRAGCVEYLIKPVQPERVLEGVARVDAKQKEKGGARVGGGGTR